MAFPHRFSDNPNHKPPPLVISPENPIMRPDLSTTPYHQYRVGQSYLDKCRKHGDMFLTKIQQFQSLLDETSSKLLAIEKEVPRNQDNIDFYRMRLTLIGKQLLELCQDTKVTFGTSLLLAQEFEKLRKPPQRQRLMRIMLLFADLPVHQKAVKYVSGKAKCPPENERPHLCGSHRSNSLQPFSTDSFVVVLGRQKVRKYNGSLLQKKSKSHSRVYYLGIIKQVNRAEPPSVQHRYNILEGEIGDAIHLAPTQKLQKDVGHNLIFPLPAYRPSIWFDAYQYSSGTKVLAMIPNRTHFKTAIVIHPPSENSLHHCHYVVCFTDSKVNAMNLGPKAYFRVPVRFVVPHPPS